MVVFEALVDEEEEVGNTHRRPSHRDEVEPMELVEEVVVHEGRSGSDWWFRATSDDRRNGGGMEMAATDGFVRRIIALEWDAGEVFFVELDVSADDELVRLDVIALEAFIPLFIPKVDAALRVDFALVPLVLHDVAVGATSEDA